MKCVALLQLLESPFLCGESLWDLKAFGTLAQSCSQRHHHTSQLNACSGGHCAVTECADN